MAIGPVEMLVVKFPGTQFTGDVVPALTDLVQSGTVRLLDVLFIRKDAAGQVGINEITDLVTTDAAVAPVVAGLTDVLSEEDAEKFGEMLDVDSSAAVILFENTWAARFAEALRAARGEVVLIERIPRVVIEELIETAAA
jgi:hypothetical protein